MPDREDTHPQGDSLDRDALDPLGVIGWVIGGKYRIKSYLGGGGFGEVYEGFNENLAEQRLVIKFFKRVQAREKFAKEAKILCMLDHPNISRVIDYLPDEGAVVVAFIDGKDAGLILKESGALPEDRFLRVARAITAAIAYAHGKRIAHRDIKPGNIIIDKSENVFLIDFGIAKEMGTEATKTAYTALTPMFAAPERQTGQRDYNPFLSDVYETGVTLFNLATNSLPYRNPTNPDISEWGGPMAKRLSPQLTRILKKATHPDPTKRHQSTRELADDLQPLTVAYNRPKRFPFVAAAAVILVVVAAVFLVPKFLGKGGDTSSVPAAVEKKDSVAVPQQKPISPPTQSPKDQKATTTPPVATPPRATETTKPPTVTDKPVPEQITPVKQDTIAQKPTPPPMSQLLVQVTPSDKAVLKIDGVTRQPGRRFEIQPGRHDALVIHPDYPIYRDKIDAPAGSIDLSLKLADKFPVIDTIELQLALSPPSENNMLELSMNGRTQTITRFPVLRQKQAAGEWEVGLKIVSAGTGGSPQAMVDSCVIFPYGGGQRQMIKGGSGIIRFARPASGKSIPMVIYWKEK
jgi:serine/threonine protein kinase